MFFIKIILIMFIIVILSYLGFIKSQKFKYRVVELKQIKEALNIFKSKIMFTYETIPSIFKEISNILSGNISSLFKIASEKMSNDSAKDAWNYCIDTGSNSLSREDCEVFKTLGNMLGKTDKEGQIAEIELVQNFLSLQIDKAEAESSKNAKLYNKLGVLAGIGVGIILI